VLEEKSSYRQILKATSVFGGVQIFNVLILIIRSKLIAILLGPYGMGIAGLLNSTIGIIGFLTNFGLGTSAVKDISAANSLNNEEHIGRIIAVYKKLVWVTGIFGVLVTLIFSSLISKIVFGNSNYTMAFLLLSITLLATQLSSGQNVILQGLRKHKLLAKAKMLGTFFGLIISLPIYYYYGIEGIVFAIIASSFITLIISTIYSKKISVKKPHISFRIIRDEGKGMIKMGLVMSSSLLISNLTSYLVGIYISRRGSVNDVGLYNAGFSLISNYVGLIFIAMSMDYYPRLSAVANDQKQSSRLTNQQAEISILIIGPILNVFFIFINWIVILFYSQKFTPINEMIHYAALGIYFKAASWCLSTIFAAKGDSKLYFLNELFGCIYGLLFNVLGYYFGGLNGLGVSFLLSYAVYFIQVFFVVKIKYQFAFFGGFYKIFLVQIGIGFICFLIAKLIPAPISYMIGIPFIVFSIIFSFRQIQQRLGFENLWKMVVNELRNMRKKGD
jgi:O-antigen/teichoic acid export membrane protein